MFRFAALLLLLVLVTHSAHHRLDAARLAPPTRLEETLVSVEAARLLSLGAPQLAADYYWLRAISHFGDKSMHAVHYPNLAPLLERVLALDPHFASGYFFAGTALMLPGQDWRRAMQLLREGVKRRPDVWYIPFLYGFNAYFFFADYALATQALSMAAELEDAPPFTGPLALRLAAQAGEPEVGLQMIDSLRATANTPELRATYEDREQRLVLELQLKNLQQAVDRFKIIHGVMPGALDEVVRVGLLAEMPQDPFGGQFFLDATGRVQTSSEEERLRLPDPAAPAEPP